MSDDFAEALWEEFAAETEEHLESIEPGLVAIEKDGPTTETISRLFRAFHSIKGLTRAMDLASMADAAHHAENLLGLVRDGKASIDREVTDLLLESVDALRALRELGIQTRANGERPAALIARLDAAFRARTGAAPKKQGQAASALLTGPVSVRPPPSARAAHDQAPVTPKPSSGISRESPTGGPATSAEQSFMEAFAELVTEEFPVVVGAVAQDEPARAKRALETLANACQVMSFEGLEEEFSSLARGVETDSPDRRRRSLAALASMRSRFALIDELYQTRLAELTRSEAVAMVVHAEIRRISPEIERIGGFPNDGDPVVRAALGAEARFLAALYELVDRPQLAQECYRLDDLAQRSSEPLREVILECIEHFHSDLDEHGPQSLRRNAAPNARGKRPLPDEVLALGIDGALVEVLDVAAVRSLRKATSDDAKAIYELGFECESAPAITRSLVDWLTQHTAPVVNRATFESGRPYLRILTVSELPLVQLRAELTRIAGPEHSVDVRACRALAERSAQEAAPVAAPAEEKKEARDASKEAAQAKAAATMLRVRGEVVDALMAQVGELLTLSNTLDQAVGGAGTEALVRRLESLVDRSGQEGRQVVASVESTLGRIRQIDQQLHGSILRLRDQTLELRVVPIDTVFSRFPRIVRTLAQKLGKDVTFETSGGETRLDKAMAESLVDPLMHMVRNAVDHGVETPADRTARGKGPQASVHLSAGSRNNRIVIELSDDGRGMDPSKLKKRAIERGILTENAAAAMTNEEAFKLIFAPGFSTAEQVTDTSGRGVGMDVVLTNVTRLGGSIAITSTLDKGTTFTLLLPLSAAIQPVLLVEAGGRVLAVPERFLAETLELDPKERQLVEGHGALVLRDAVLPLHDLDALLEAKPEPRLDARCPVVIVQSGPHRLGLVVDRLVGRRELYVKEVHPAIVSIPGLSGAAVLGDGRAVLIVDGEELLRLAADTRRQPVPVAGLHPSTVA
jgi:two-component system, chemotaxis family, sensor kinase CheA